MPHTLSPVELTTGAQPSFKNLSKYILLTLLLLGVFVFTLPRESGTKIAKGQDLSSHLDSASSIELNTEERVQKAEDLVRQGDRFYDRGRFQQAVEKYSQAIELSPTYAVAYEARGDAYSQLGEYDLKVKELSVAISLRPKDAWLYEKRARVLEYLARFDESLTDCEKAEKLGSKSNAMYYTLAHLYESKNQFANSLIYRTRSKPKKICLKQNQSASGVEKMRLNLRIGRITL